MSYELAFIGAGNMAEAIARAAINKGVLSPEAMIATDPSDARREVFATLGIRAVENGGEAVASAKQVLMAVKPQVMREAAATIAQHGSAGQIIISIMAGISSDKIAEAIVSQRTTGGDPPRVVRVMPNTPMQIGCGMAGLSLGKHARPGDEDLTLKLFRAGGEAIVVPESSLDAITAVSGSGPAYLFYLAEAMEKAARELGLKEHAALLVRQTLLGSARLLAESGEPPAELRRKVTSPGGTTEAAIRHLDGNKSIDVVVNALKAAEKRSKELGA